MSQRGRPKGVKNGEGKMGRMRIDRDKNEWKTRAMFTLPTHLGGSACLDDLVRIYGGQDRVCRDLKISRELLNLYLRGQQEPPFTLLLALYWQTPDGFGQAFSETHMTHMHNFQMRRTAESRARLLNELILKTADLIGRDHPISAFLAAGQEHVLSLSGPSLDHAELGDVSKAAREELQFELVRLPRSSGPKGTKVRVQRQRSSVVAQLTPAEAVKVV